ncbi:MAG TPA: HNH endonuclease, partial [Arthrobacter sp.]|nr:HNH endonuclease [Arthrobacter sp.]
DQYEHLLTTMNAAANPRARGCAPETNKDSTHNDGTGKAESGTGIGNGGGDGTDPGRGSGSASTAATGCAMEAGTGTAAAIGGGGEGRGGPVPAAAVDQRSVAQKRLDGLVAACDIALAGHGLPATGGHRPQIMAVIDYQELLAQLNQVTGGDEDDDDRLDAIFGPGSSNSAGNDSASAGCGSGFRTSRGLGASSGNGGGAVGGSGSYAFGGPVHAGNIRRLACDAEIIPVVMAGDGQILDVGTGRRLFPPHLRRALVARDGGCAFPGCTMPAPWTEAHHIKYATDDGETSTDNGCLLCSFHHHLVHKEKWAITVRNGVPWFVPPAYVDPDRRPIRNHYFNRKPHRPKPHQTEIEFANTG